MYDIHSISRRQLFQTCGIGLGKIALATLLTGGVTQSIFGESSPANPKTDDQPVGPHFKPKAQRVIFMFMAGAPSQLDLFDHKPKLTQLEGQPIPPSVIGGQRYAFIQPDAAVLGPRFPFAKHGKCGAELSDRLPWLAKVVDDIALIKSCTSDQFNHAPAQIKFATGDHLPGRPAMGAWMSYGLGSEANDLPSFVVLNSGGGLSGGSSLWSAGFLPGKHQGVPFRSAGDPILHIANPLGVDHRAQQETMELISKLNRARHKSLADPENRDSNRSL